MKIGILGGTFDPIHQGHLVLAQIAKAQYHLDKVIFIPARMSPHKVSSPQMTPADLRYKMVELALQHFPEFEVSDIELKRSGISYTVETLREFQSRYPQAELFLILGGDSLAHFSTWKESEAILKMAKLLVAQRPGIAPQQAFSPTFSLVKMPEMEISSSEIRQKIREGETLGRMFLPKEVEASIHQMNLYKD